MCSYAALTQIAFVSAFLKLHFSSKFVQTKLLSCIIVRISLWSNLVKLATLQLDTYLVKLGVLSVKSSIDGLLLCFSFIVVLGSISKFKLLMLIASISCITLACS